MAHSMNKSLLTLAERLRTARTAKGLSTRAVAAHLSRYVRVSHATIANYEKGESQPTVATLSYLATLYERPLNWFLDTRPTLSGIQYRNVKSKVRENDKHQFELQAQLILEAYARLENYLIGERSARFSMASAPDGATPIELAAWVRQLAGLGPHEPVRSVIELLEDFGIRVVEVPTQVRIDALAAMLGPEHVVALNPPAEAHDRMRMTAAHELGHVLLNHCSGRPSSVELEKAAYEFASHLLMPQSVLEQAFEGRSMVRLVKFREMYGISLAAMLYRADGTLIPERLAKSLWIEFAKRGWKTREPGSVRPDRASRFEQLLDGAIVSGELTWPAAAEVTGLREDELRARIQVAMGGQLQEEEAEDQRGGGSGPSGLKLVR